VSVDRGFPVIIFKFIEWLRLDRRKLHLITGGGIVLAIASALLLCLEQTNFLLWLIVSIGAGGLAAVAFLLAPKVEARLLVEQGRTLVSVGGFQQALSVLNRAVDFAPRLVSARLVRSAAYAGLGQLDLSLDDAERAVKLAPQSHEARLVRARLFSYHGLYEDAIKDLRIGIGAKPDWITGYMELMQLHIRLQDYNSSLATLRDLSTNNDSDQVRYDSLIYSGWVYEEKLSDLDSAITAYTRAIPLLPDRKIGYLRRACAYRARGDKYQAAEDFLRAAQRNPTPEDTGQYHWLRAACYWGRYVITDDAADFQAWIDALERSVKEDAANFGQQSKQWLATLREKRLSADTIQRMMGLPPTPQIFPN
jgi:tetratricopeptide (TPR) repeat protein